MTIYRRGVYHGSKHCGTSNLFEHQNKVVVMACIEELPLAIPNTSQEIRNKEILEEPSRTWRLIRYGNFCVDFVRD